MIIMILLTIGIALAEYSQVRYNACDSRLFHHMNSTLYNFTIDLYGIDLHEFAKII